MSVTKANAKKILDRVKSARTQLESLLKDRTWIDEAKKVAEKQGKEVKKIVDADVAKLRVFLEKEKKELEKLQSQIPGEVARIKKFVDAQKKELAGLLKSNLKTKKKGAAKKKATATARSAKKAGSKKKSGSSKKSGASVGATS